MDDAAQNAELIALREELRKALEKHLESLGLQPTGQAAELPTLSKETIRQMHAAQRRELAAREWPALEPHINRLIVHFANGDEIDPERVNPELVPVVASEESGLLFRLATQLWSVPVSRGFGRRIRFLVRDRFNGKLIGLFALGDPVFNLRARDNWIGWSVADRKARLVNVMDAFVVGAVPPYSQLLGGKLVCSLIGSAEVSDFFQKKYAGCRGIISGEYKDNKLALVTVTSALGRSSLYNRLRLPGLVELYRIGETRGWGHFHVPRSIFESMRHLLELEGHPYANGYKFGNGPNWRMRVVRAALGRLSMDGDLLRHGITREVYAMPIAKNWREYLLGKDSVCVVDRPPAEAIAAAARERWIVPRSKRRPEYKCWTRKDTLNQFEILQRAYFQNASE